MRTDSVRTDSVRMDSLRMDSVRMDEGEVIDAPASPHGQVWIARAFDRLGERPWLSACTAN